MAVSRSRGVHLPGFDCEIGKALSYTAAEWRYRIHGMKLVSNNFTGTVRVYVEDKLRYEIYATTAELQ